MRAFIHYTGGRPFAEECTVAQRGFEELGVECVPFSSNEALEAAAREDAVVAGTLVTGHALARWGVVPPDIDYPEDLDWLLGRRVWRGVVGELGESGLPLFVKPVHDKELPAVVARSMGDLASYEAMGEGYPVLCSEPVRFTSEWRFFVRYGEIAGLACYRGDAEWFPDFGTVDTAIARYVHAPNAYALDVGVAEDGRTLLVEVNDGYSVGCYGVDCVAYALFLAARWAELVGARDEFAGLDLKGMVRASWPRRDYNADGLEMRLRGVEGATESFVSVAMNVAEWNVIGGSLIARLREGRCTSEDNLALDCREDRARDAAYRRISIHLSARRDRAFHRGAWEGGPVGQFIDEALRREERGGVHVRRGRECLSKACACGHVARVRGAGRARGWYLSPVCPLREGRA